MRSGAVAAGLNPQSLAVDPAGKYVYVANKAGNSVSQYAIGTDGSLAPIAADVAAGTGPQSIAADPSGKYVYVANIASGNVSQYAIRTGGSLTAIASIAAGSSPQSVSVDPSGHHVYVANRGSSTVSIYAIGANGSLTGNTPSSVPSQAAPQSIAMTTAAVRLVPLYAYAANEGDNSVSEYTLGSDGSLAPMSTAAVATGSGPRSLAADPSRQFAYVTNAAGGNISQFTIRAQCPPPPPPPPPPAGGGPPPPPPRPPCPNSPPRR